MENKIKLLSQDSETRDIFEFFINLPRDDFRLYGQFFKDIYECKVQDGSKTSKVLNDREKRDLGSKIDAYIMKETELQNSITEKDKIISGLKTDAERESKLRVLDIQEKVNVEKSKIQKDLFEESEKIKMEASGNICSLENDKRVQAEEIMKLRLELENEKKMKKIDINMKTSAEISKQEGTWKALIDEKDNQIRTLQSQKDDQQNKFEKHLMQGNTSMAQSNDILKSVKEIEKTLVKPLNSSQIGQIGEEFVLQALKKAFPNNRIFLTRSNHCGDIIFEMENTSKRIMFEIKDVDATNIKNHKQGNDIKKFYTDSKSNKSGFQIDAGVLVSLNCIVDPAVPNLTPFVKEGKPYMYVDNGKSENSDPVSLFQAVVGMMKFMIEHCKDNKMENFGVKINEYVEQTNKTLEIYQQMWKDHNTMGNRLKKLKECLDGHIKILESDRTENEKSQKRNGDKLCEPNPKYPKAEPLFNNN